MTPADIDRVFGRSRLRMVTGAHVEVFREASLPGERRRYTKRFLATPAGDFRQWTEREWRILARLVGHGIGPVPDVVQFDRGAADRPALVQTYDAGITVDHWATLLPVERAGVSRRHVFEDCAHWWALARHCLIALDAIHQLQLVHLDLKADNVCIPAGPADFDPRAPDAVLNLRFEQIALIDFAFSLVSGERLDSALPIARQTEYDYQSPRLLQALEAGAHGDLAPTRALDWRCDIFSLAAMLRRYLPEPQHASDGDWTPARRAQACALIRRLLDVHDAELPAVRPHAELMALASAPLRDDDLASSLQRGWTLETGRPVPHSELPTPVTRIAMPVVTGVDAEPITIDPSDIASRSRHVAPATARPRRAAWAAALGALALLAVASVPLFGHPGSAWRDWVAGFSAASGSGHDAEVDRDASSARADGAGPSTPRADSSDARMSSAAPVKVAVANGADAAAQAAESAALPQRSASPAGSTAPDASASSTSPASPRAADAASGQAQPTIASGDLHPTVPTASSTPGASADERGRPVGTLAASAHARGSAPARAGDRDAARASGRFAAADRSKARTTAAASGRSGALAASSARVASARAKRDGGSRSDGALVASRSDRAGVASRSAARVGSKAGIPIVAAKPAAPLAVARPSVPAIATPPPDSAPQPWPHTAMASGMATDKARAEGRRVPEGARSAPMPSAGANTERSATAPSSGPTATATLGASPPAVVPNARPQAFPASPAATFVPPVVAPMPARGVTPPPAIPVEPTDPTGPRPSIAAERGRFGAPALVPAAAAYSPSADSRAAAPADFHARAGDVMANQLPRLAQRAERSVMRVLFTAARTDAGAQDDEVRQAASAMRRAPDEALADLPLAPADARQLNDAARTALQRRGSAREAADLQLRAFGANPTDAEVVGNLAVLRLKQQPTQAETARQLALHALTLPDARFPQGRLEDWTTFAIASALGGRERDARNAWWVAVTLAPSLQRQCRVATDAYAQYGERLRSSVESMLQRLQASGRADGSPFCAWPPYWTVGSSR
jgi:serine/threonine protein kinase